METIKTTQELKRNFLEIWREISPEDIDSLINYESNIIIEKKIKKQCTKEFPLNKVLLIFHAYACIAYITAEIKVNVKIYIDCNKKDFMLLTYKKNSNPDTCSIVYSTIQDLCNYPFYPVPVKDIFEFIENSNIVNGLIDFYKKNV